MFEDDAILPDDYQADPPQSDEENTELPADEGFDTTETDSTEETTEAPISPTFKIKYNKEEQEIGYDDAVPLIQKGMNYDKLQERLQEIESDPRLSFVEELAQERGMEVHEFLGMFREQQEQERLNELIEQNIPEEYAREMLESRKDREERKKEKEESAKKEKENAEYGEFFEVFKEANDRDFNGSQDQIPQEVWDAHAQGVPLKFAYMQHHNSQLKAQIQTYKQNEENAKKAPVGSLTSYGSADVTGEDDFMRGFNSI
jgi:hypothetical protein